MHMIPAPVHVKIVRTDHIMIDGQQTEWAGNGITVSNVPELMSENEARSLAKALNVAADRLRAGGPFFA